MAIQVRWSRVRPLLVAFCLGLLVGVAVQGEPQGFAGPVFLLAMVVGGVGWVSWMADWRTGGR